MFIALNTGSQTQKVLATEELRRIRCHRNWITFWYRGRMARPEFMLFRTTADAQNSYRWIRKHYIQELSGGYKQLLFLATL